MSTFFKLVLVLFIFVTTTYIFIPRIAKWREKQHRNYVNSILFRGAEYPPPQGVCKSCGKKPATRYFLNTTQVVCEDKDCWNLQMEKYVELMEVTSY